MKTELFVVDINYHKEITSITLPLLEKYANKIGAKFTIITDQKFTTMHPSYEKMQIYELGKDNDFSLIIDSDMIIKPEMYNVIDLIPNDGYHIGCWESFYWDGLYNNRGIDVGIASNFLIIPNACLELLKPLDKSEDFEKYCDRPAYVNEYCISLNRQRMGYKLAGFQLPGSRDVLFKHLNITTDHINVIEAVNIAKKFCKGKI